MTEEQRLRIASAKALYPHTATANEHGVFCEGRYWAPDKEGHEAQLVELLARLREGGHESFAALCRALAKKDWKLAIMRAVAEVSNDKS